MCSQCCRFHPNPFNFGRVIVERVNIVFSERELTLYAIAVLSVCLSSVCNVGAPYSAGWNLRQFFFTIWYLDHPLTITEKVYGNCPSGTPPSGGLNARGVAKYSDFSPLHCCIFEKVQHRRQVCINLDMSFRLIPKSVTLNDPERRNGPYFA